MDRTTLEAWQEMDGLEAGEYALAGETEYYGPGQGEYYGQGEFLGESAYLGEAGYPGESGYLGEREYLGEGGFFREAGLDGGGEIYGEAPGVFNENDEMALAAELLAVNSDEELDQFLGNLIRRASRVVGKAITSPVGRQIGGMLKSVAKRALPMVGGSLGNLLLPGIGGMVGSQLASRAGSMFGLEVEGLSSEDQQFEIARRIVRLGGGAVGQALRAPYGRSPQQAARSAWLAAARRYAPGLAYPGIRPGIMGAYGAAYPSGQRVGRWYRRGDRIVLIGV
jgi:hypothetical protein